ncbi:TetR/AcrR family transcriptional regulator [Levilactobacillus angrenensis]|uniref:TetR/AcrR family transcriptional regulator n=1 Tax=Levilactobacillus angrenensis TaxID=2486020 RepID=A0ABW1U5G7_9LACO|nr:TetR/AcrR family transcriptional regulator [Levilactobacillus angrenensis]
MAKKKRRRGTELVDAILTAAWEQLQAKGYQNVTIEGIAAAAATTKTVLYRRWPDKAHLIIAALSKFGNLPDYQAPDTGSLRDDLLNLFGQMAALLDRLQEETLRGLLADRIQHLEFGEIFSHLNTGEQLKGLIQPLLDHAAARGEISHADWPDRVVTLPGVLLLNEILGQQTLTPAAQTEMVDDILLPIFLARPAQ